jgi:hypothetical protein
MTVLYNGKAEKYLVEDKYAISISLRLQVFAPQPLQHTLKVFVGGIGKPQKIDGKNLFLRSVVVNFPTNAPHQVLLGLCTKFLINFGGKISSWGTVNAFIFFNLGD